MSGPSILFCRCGSSAVDINHWTDEETAVFQCYTCGAEEYIKNFTIGRAFSDESKEVLNEAKTDIAKYRNKRGAN